MNAFSVTKFEDRQWLLHHYEKMRHQKDMFGGSFFSILLLTFFFFLTPFPHEMEDNLILWKLALFILFIVITIGWYVRSTQYYAFCIKFLNYEYRQKRFPKEIRYEVTRFSAAQIVMYIVLALIIPIFASFFLHEDVDLSFLYWISGILSILTVFTFLLKIEDFYEKRERLEEIEILTEALVYHDPLEVFDKGENLEVRKRVKRLKEESFKYSKKTKEVNHPTNNFY